MKSRYNFRLFILIILSATTIVSCKKIKYDQPSCNIIAEEQVTSQGTFTLKNNVVYNNDGTVSYKSPGGQLKTIHYPGDITIMGEAGDVWYKKIFTLNEAGMLTDERTEYTADGTDWSDMSFEYQNSVQLIRSITTTPHQLPSENKYTWSGANLQSSVYQGPGEATEVFDYFMNKPSAPGDYFTHQNIVVGNGFRIFVSKNLPKSSGSSGYLSSFGYVYDNKGKIISMTISNQPGPSLTVNYDYLCDDNFHYSK